MKCVASLHETLDEAYRLASSEAEKARGKQKHGYDKRVRYATLQPGDRVLVRILAFEGRHKIADKWEDKPYVVLEHKNPDLPVYVVQCEEGSGPKRTLHRNHLLPIGSLPVPGKPAQDRKCTTKKRGKSKKKHEAKVGRLRLTFFSQTPNKRVEMTWIKKSTMVGYR